jgi:flagellar basal body-associated protein FliL
MGEEEQKQEDKQKPTHKLRNIAITILVVLFLGALITGILIATGVIKIKPAAVATTSTGGSLSVGGSTAPGAGTTTMQMQVVGQLSV